VTELCFVLARGQNHFFFELADALRAELEATGVRTALSTSGFPDTDGDCVFALLPPHEYFALEGHRRPPSGEALARTIFITAEQPESVHFRQNAALAPAAGALFDINERAVRAYRRRGHGAQHLQLGYTPSWDHFDPGGRRELDVIFMGAHTPRRGQILGGAASALSGLQTRLVLSDNSKPNSADAASFLAGEAKWRALSSARVLLNIHQGPEPYFEWHRALQAIHCGAAVLTETSTDLAPLEPGVHLEMGPPQQLAELSVALATDPERARRLAGDAYALIRERLPLSTGAGLLADAAEDLLRGRGGASGLRGRARSRLTEARLRVSGRLDRIRAATGEAEHPEAGMQRDERAEPAVVAAERDGRLLFSAADCQLLPSGADALHAALSDAPGASFSYGLVASKGPGGIYNPFAWEPGTAVAPPILVERAVLDELAASLPPDPSGGALIARVTAAGAGVNAQTFVARMT